LLLFARLPRGLAFLETELPRGRLFGNWALGGFVSRKPKDAEKLWQD
jgi:hypothetical protein